MIGKIDREVAALLGVAVGAACVLGWAYYANAKRSPKTLTGKLRYAVAFFIVRGAK